MLRKAIFSLGVFVLLLLAACGGSTQVTTITVLFTSDMHGVITSPDAETPGCLARVADLIRRARAEVPNLLVLDGGDTIQGNPLMYIAARQFADRPNPIIDAMNAAGYDAMAVGNHEFNFGMDYLRHTQEQAAFPYLCANIVDENSGMPVFPPFTVKEIEGLKVGIIGVVTNGIPNWELPEHIAGLEFQEPVEGVRNFLPTLKEAEGCDIVIVLAHTGFPHPEEGGTYAEMDDERNALAIARLDDVDLLLTGHIHQLMEPQMVEKTFAATCPPYARGAIRIEMTIERSGDEVTSVNCGGGFIEIDDAVPVDEEILAAAQPMIDTTEEYLDTVLANSSIEIDAAPERLTDSPIVDLIHQAQLEATGAELSIASLLPWAGVEIPVGPFKIRKVFEIYPYENQMLTVRATGTQLKAFLEHAANYYDDAWLEGDVLKVDIDEKISKYNVDNIEGLTYRIDPTREEGDRVVDLKYKGSPIDPERGFTVAVNSYRFAGGGGFDMFDPDAVVSPSALGAREILIEYIKEHGLGELRATGNWFVSPDGRKHEKLETDER